MKTLLAALALLIAQGCAEDPCKGKKCDRFFNADCKSILISGEQHVANFFWRGSNVTDKCNITTCDTRSCPSCRQCVEEVETVPCIWEPCQQYLRTRCVIIIPPRPMTCADVTCGEQRACWMRDRGLFLPPVVRCLPYRSFGNCDEVTCDEGLTCVELGRSSITCTDTITPEVADVDTTTPEVADVDTTTPEREVTDVETTIPATNEVPLSAICEEVVCSQTASCHVVPTEDVEAILQIIADSQQPEPVDGPNSPVCLPFGIEFFFQDVTLYP